MELKKSNETVEMPEGKKVVVQAIESKGFDKEDISYEYNVYLVEELRPLHRLQEDPIRDYSDYTNESFFKSREDMLNSLSQKNILSFIKENHPEIMEYIVDKGLVLYPKWIPYCDLV